MGSDTQIVYYHQILKYWCNIFLKSWEPLEEKWITNLGFDSANINWNCWLNVKKEASKEGNYMSIYSNEKIYIYSNEEHMLFHTS